MNVALKGDITVALAVLRGLVIRVNLNVPVQHVDLAVLADHDVPFVDRHVVRHLEVRAHIRVADLGFPVDRRLLSPKDNRGVAAALSLIPVVNDLKRVNHIRNLVR